LAGLLEGGLSLWLALLEHVSKDFGLLVHVQAAELLPKRCCLSHDLRKEHVVLTHSSRITLLYNWRFIGLVADKALTAHGLRLIVD